MMAGEEGPIQVYVVTDHHFHGELLARHLGERLNLICRHHNTLDPCLLDRQSNGCRTLFLCEQQFFQQGNITGLDSEALSRKSDSLRIALFGVDNDQRIEEDALGAGVSGIFFHKDSLEVFDRGVRAILAGELWFSRTLLSRTLQSLQRRQRQLPADDPAQLLTRREREVLARIAAGDTNQDIADNCHISLHTVKTHISNIYSKINATSRIQAIFWAAKYLG